jgi:hypothetical protein
MGQSHRGTAGRKQVLRSLSKQDSKSLYVSFNGQEARDKPRRDAAALVADAYCAFLFGPMWFARRVEVGDAHVVKLTEVTTMIVGEDRFECDLLYLRLQPGFGFSSRDEAILYVDRQTHLMRRIRFSLEGLDSTRGALVEVDTLAPLHRHGVQWPTQFHEKLLRPAPLDVHRWRLTGLDVNRGYDAQALRGDAFAGAAAPPASILKD